MRRYGDLPREVPELSALCARPGRAQDITPDSKFQWMGDQPVVAFGKHGGALGGFALFWPVVYKGSSGCLNRILIRGFTVNVSLRLTAVPLGTLTRSFCMAYQHVA